jgi:hypothetical protein
MPVKSFVDNPVNQIVGRLVTDAAYRGRFVADMEGALVEMGFRVAPEEWKVLASIRTVLTDPQRRDRLIEDLREFVSRYIDESYISY